MIQMKYSRKKQLIRVTQFLAKLNKYSTRVLEHIDQAQKICTSRIRTRCAPISKESYVKAKEQLTNESRQFVTASKLFVKTVQNERQLVECLNHCLIMIERIVTIADKRKHRFK